ncbi:MAG: DUF2934 domain-containing protein [Verrucomicrobiota bacterium]
MNTDTIQPPNDEEIACFAYHLWEAEGCQHGRDTEYWFQAKAHLIARRKHDAGLLAAADSKNMEARENPVAKPMANDVKPAKQRKANRPGSPTAYA